MTAPESPLPFSALGLHPLVLKALESVGYENPSPIQAAMIPPMLEGRDVLGQAQTGTGKTAAFALPILSRIDLARRQPQSLILAPTRELAIQVAEALQTYAAKLPDFHILPIYGGQAYQGQLKALSRGVHVVVGTPGRVVDHIKRGTLKLDGLTSLVLDEADEMLRMGFVDDVEWVLAQTPPTRQVALFSATMPDAIRRIARQHLSDPVEVKIKTKTSTAQNIRQRMWVARGMHKLDALTRILEGEDFDGVIIFVRTKLATVELADKLAARGHEAAAINGDMDQKARERTIEQFKASKLDILVATDVVARGIDVDRVSHVINYDIPHDTESYVHRIGRTGRAGRKGEAILFVAPREQRLLYAIERATRQTIDVMDLPTVENINDRRTTDFQQRLRAALAADNDPERDLYRRLVAEVAAADEVDPLDVAAAVVRLAQGEQSMLLAKPARPERPERRDRDVPRRERSERPERPRHAKGHGPENEGDMPPMDTFRIAVGRQHNVEPRNIVGAIANEAGLDSAYIGRIDIREDYSLVDLPAGMPKDIFKDLKKTWVAGQQLQIRRWSEHPPQRNDTGDQRGPGRPGPKRPPKTGRGKPPRSGPRAKPPRG